MRPRQTWIVFGLCLAVLLTAMGWVSLTVLRLDRAEAAARQRAAIEENVRLALWRMDSAVAPLVAGENARPYFAYSAFYPPERTYNKMFAEIERDEVLVPSVLLTTVPPHVVLHFQFGPDGAPTSPQVPTGNMRDIAEEGYTTGEKIDAFAARLTALDARLNRQTLLAVLLERRPPTSQPSQPTRLAQAGPQGAQGADQSPRQRTAQEQEQSLRNVEEFQARVRRQFDTQQTNVAVLLNPSANVREGTMTPLWAGDVLLLARRVRVNGQTYAQGCQLDWPAIRTWLLAEVRDLLPGADLEPVDVAQSPSAANDGGSEPPLPSGERDAVRGTAPPSPTVRLSPAPLPSRERDAVQSPSAANVTQPSSVGERGRLLAALPVRLVSGRVAAAPARGLTPTCLSLIVAWAGAVLAAVAVALLLRGALTLSERRGAFVSAVTHELRTPLTTFQMYTEMLADGMVTEEGKRRAYIETLRGEADRLSHLVENVLAYARLEHRRPGGRVETVALRDLLDRLAGRLAARAERSGMTVCMESADGVGVRTDTAAVDQVLFNLVDNACKYAAAEPDRRIHIQADTDGAMVAIRVRDHGPGITRREARRLFRPFRKSAGDAAHSAPGVGLGLALSRQLARQLGGDLRLDETVTDGACFVLTLPCG